jgi:hypothetical protein
MRHWKLLEAMTQQGITPSRTVPACQSAQPDQYGNEATDKLVGGFPGAMEHQVRPIVNPSDAGMSAVHAGVGVAHLGRFRALAGASRGFGRGLWARPHRCSILSRSARVAVARKNTSIQEPKVTKMTMTKFHVLAIAVGLLPAISGSSFAAPQSRHASSTHSQGAVKENRGIVTSPSRVPAFDPRGTSAYPFGPGVNFPYLDRPYGDPDHW